MNKLILRDYQSIIIHSVYQAMLEGYKKPLVVLPCGGGKTVVFAYMASQTQQKGNKVWFLVHRRELLDQTIETFKRFGISMNNIFVGMVATVARRLDKMSPPDLIVIDEAHHASAATWKRIIDRFDKAWLIGLTATPCRLDGKPLGQIFDTLIEGPTVSQMIRSGWLSDYRYLAPTVTDLSGLKKRGADYDRTDAADALMKRAIYGDVIQHWKAHADGLKTIVYCTTIEHSRAMAHEFRIVGIRAAHFDGNTPAKERKETVKAFRDGEITVLCNVDLIGEGFDVPDCWCCVLLRPTMSTGLFVQQSGRALRPQPGKTAVILDHVGNYIRHGLPATEREWSLTERIKPVEQYREDGLLLVRQCEFCFHTFETGPEFCPACGMCVRKTQEEIKRIEEIELKEITERQAEQMKRSQRKQEGMARSYEDFRRIAKERGYHAGWAYHRAKARGYIK